MFDKIDRRYRNGLKAVVLGSSLLHMSKSASSHPISILSAIQREPHLHCHLPMRHLVILELAAHPATSNQLILRIVFPARLVALFTAFSTPSEEEPTSSIFLLGVVTHEHIESFQVVSGEHISRFRGPSSNSTNKGHRDSVCVESARRGSNRPRPAAMYRKRKQNRTAGMFRF